MRALIVEHGASRAALAASRALAAGGWTVGNGSPAHRSPSAASRAVVRHHPVPLPGEGVDAFVAAVSAAVEEEGYEVIFPADDAEVLALSERRADIPAVVTLPPHPVVLRALDKLELTASGERAGLAVPRTWPLAADDAPPSRGPFVVKARFHAASGTTSRVEASVAATGKEAIRHGNAIRAGGREPFAQERLEGRLEAFVALVDRDGRTVVAAQQASERIYPPGTGLSVRARTVPIDRALAQRVEALLGDLGWVGLAELQFIRPPGGEPHLIDFNGRLYGSLALAVAAGPNLPDLWARLATARPLPAAVPPAEPGIRYQWLEGDLKRALVERSGGLAADVRQSLRYALGARHSIWSASDPWPALDRVATLAGRSIRRLIGGRRGS